MPLASMLGVSIIIGLTAMCGVVPVRSQGCSGHAGSWLSLDRLDLVQTLDRKTPTSPASFSLSLPAGEPRSEAINAAVRYNLPINERYVIGPSIEAAVNTTAAKKQDNIKGGITGDLTLRSPCAPSATVLPILSLGIEGYRDRVRKTHGWINQVQVTLQPKGASGPIWYLSNQEFAVGNAASVVLTPYVGLEHQTSDSAGTSASVLRWKASYSANVLPFPHFFRERLSLQATDEIRHDWVGHYIDGDASTTWFVASANFVLFSGTAQSGEKHTASIGVTYKKGANPAQGFQRQEVTQVLFEILY